MKKTPTTVLSLLLLFGTIINTQAQSTTSRVAQILQTNCTATSCHGSSDTQVFDLTGNAQDVYNAIVNVAPANTVAAAKGHKLVRPGYPDRSFLLRKIANGISADLPLETSEGDACPKNAYPLTKAEIELVRQWIMFGCSQTQQIIDEQTIIDFYDGKALEEIQPPPAPPAGQGFQLHDGPIFLKPGEEREYQWKFETEVEAVEVNRVEAFLSPQSHHYIVYKYDTGKGMSSAYGHRRIDDLYDQFEAFTEASMVATWQFNRNHELPQGTAYYWEPGARLISNFHVRNYDDDSILAAHVYMNVYTQPQGSGAIQMFSQLAVYGGFDPTSLNIPNTGDSVPLSFIQSFPETWNIWVLQAHTHKLAKDYDIFLRNSDGSRGQQVYEGWFDYDQAFNKGYYDFAHPPVLEFSPLLPVNMQHGLIHEATYLNDGPNDIGFGLTTNEEMFITYMHYTKASPTGIRDVAVSNDVLNIHPNPADGQFRFSYELPDAGKTRIEIFNLTGERIALLKDEYQSKGTYNETFEASRLGLSSGVHFIRVSSPHSTSLGKLVIGE